MGKNTLALFEKCDFFVACLAKDIRITKWHATPGHTASKRMPKLSRFAKANRLIVGITPVPFADNH
jgi:hypothetical protein